MFDLGWSEIALIVLIAVVILGPKELPNAMRTAGQWMRRFRMLASDFQRHLDVMVQEADLAEVREQAKKLAQTDLTQEIKKTIDPDGSVAQSLTAPTISEGASAPVDHDPTQPHSADEQGSTDASKPKSVSDTPAS